MKYTPEMNIELRRAVQNFNKKIKRLEAKGVSSALLPSKATVRGLKLAYNNKRDLQRRLKEMNTLSSRGILRKNSKNVIGTDILFSYRQKADINKARSSKKHHLKRLKLQPAPYKSVRDDAILNTEAKIKFLNKDIENVDIKTLERINKNALNKEQRAKTDNAFVEGYMKRLYIEASQSNYDYNKAKQIEKELRKFTPQQILELKETDANVATIDEQWIDSDTKLSRKGQITLANKLDALYDALPEIKAKYGIK